jgi:hypothetical protein
MRTSLGGGGGGGSDGTAIGNAFAGVGGGAGGGGGGGASIPSDAGAPNGSSIPRAEGSPGVSAAAGRVGKGGDPRGMEAHIRETAAKYGIDPDTAVAVAKSEGLSTFQSSVKRSGKGSFNGREDSWGAFQLYKGGGLGNDFQKQTGLDPADPANEKAGIDFALQHASKKGWGSWYGAKKAGIGNFAGIGGKAQPDGQANPVASGQDGSWVNEQQGKVAGIRKGALSPETRSFLQAAGAEHGLRADVYSGGQRMHGAEGATGSHRHDKGGAGDFKLFDPKLGRYLNSANPEDAKRMEAYAASAVKAGATGIGHGAGYMGTESWHIGGGKTASWGGSPLASRALQEGMAQRGQTARIDQQVAQSPASGQVNVTVNSNGTKAQANASTSGDLFQPPKIQQHKQMQATEEIPI